MHDIHWTVRFVPTHTRKGVAMSDLFRKKLFGVSIGTILLIWLGIKILQKDPHSAAHMVTGALGQLSSDMDSLATFVVALLGG